MSAPNFPREGRWGQHGLTPSVGETTRRCCLCKHDLPISAFSPTERRWLEGHSDPIARAAAQVLHLKPSTVEQLMRGPTAVNLRCAEIIRAFLRNQDYERLARFLRPIDDALAQVDHPKLDAPLVLSETQADGAEDVAQMAYQLFPSAATAREFLRRGDESITRLRRLLQAVADLHGVPR